MRFKLQINIIGSGRQQFIEYSGVEILRRFCFNLVAEKIDKRWDRLLCRACVILSRCCPSYCLPVSSDGCPIKFDLPRDHEFLPEGIVTLVGLFTFLTDNSYVTFNFLQVLLFSFMEVCLLRRLICQINWYSFFLNFPYCFATCLICIRKGIFPQTTYRILIRRNFKRNYT